MKLQVPETRNKAEAGSGVMKCLPPVLQVDVFKDGDNTARGQYANLEWVHVELMAEREQQLIKCIRWGVVN